MIVIDVETTGLDPKKHAIVSIGAVEFENPDNHFYGECRIAETVAVDARALEVNGFSRDQLNDQTKPTLTELAQQFDSWLRPLESKLLAAHNTSFDEGMLKAAYETAALRWPFSFCTIDLQTVAYVFMKKLGVEPPLRNGWLALSANRVHEFTGLPREPEPHHGLTGAKMEAESFARLINGKNLLKEFAQYPLPSQLDNNLEQTLF